VKEFALDEVSKARLVLLSYPLKRGFYERMRIHNAGSETVDRHVVKVFLRYGKQLGKKIVICPTLKGRQGVRVNAMRGCFWIEEPIWACIPHMFGSADQKGSQILPREGLDASGKRGNRLLLQFHKKSFVLIVEACQDACSRHAFGVIFPLLNSGSSFLSFFPDGLRFGGQGPLLVQVA